MRINVNPVYLEKVLYFMYHGQVSVEYDEMEGFLQTCRFMKVKLFKVREIIEKQDYGFFWVEETT